MSLGRQRSRRWIIYAIAGFLAVVIIGAFVVEGLLGILPDPGRGTDSYKGGIGEVQARMTLPQATMLGGTLHPAGSEDTRHLFDTDPNFPEYSTVPPTSGPHLGRPETCGFYPPAYIDPVTERLGVPDRALVHNLEHGNVVMSYNLPVQDDVDRLEQVHLNLNDSDLWLITRHYDKIPEGQIAMTAWGVLDIFNGVDEGRIESFYNAYKGNRFSAETQSVGRGIPCAGAQDTMER